MDSLKSTVEKVVNEIYQRDGQVQPSVLVEAARPVESAAHGAFEWDDSKAGEEYRLIQARGWIRKVEIVVDNRPEQLVHVPTIKRQTDGGSEGYYKPVSVVAQSRDEYALALAQMTTRFNAVKSSFEQLKAAAGKKNLAKLDKGLRRVGEALNGQRMATL